MAIKSEAQKRAVEKYQKAHTETITIRYKKGVKDMIQDHAALTGESMAGFVLRACKEQMARDRAEGRTKSPED